MIKPTAQLVIFFLLAYSVKLVSLNPANISLIWYANAWAIAVLVDSRLKNWIWMLAGFTAISFLANLAGGATLQRSLTFTYMNALQIGLGAWVIHRLNVWHSMENSVKSLIRLLLLGIVLPPTIVAPLAGIVLGSGDDYDLTATIRWFVGAAVSGMAIYPTYASISKAASRSEVSKCFDWKTIVCMICAIAYTAGMMLALKGPFSYIALMLAVVAMILPFAGLSIIATATIVTEGLMISREWHTLLAVESEWLELPRLLIVGIVAVPAMLISVYVNANAEQAREIMKRKQELEVELDQRRLLFENSSDPIVLLDTQLNAILINSRMAYLLGLEKGTQSIREFARYFVKIDEAGLQERLNSSTGGRVNFETELRNESGRVFPVEITSAGSQWQGQRVWMMACRDITERRNVELHIKGLLEFNQRIVETSPAGVLIFDEQGNCILANTSATRITGQPQIELLSHNFKSDDGLGCDKIRDMAQKAAATGQTVNGIVQTNTRNGNDLWMDCYFKRFEEAGQQRLLMLISDNTERIKAQAELEQARHDLQSVLDAVPSLIAYWDSNQINRFTNLACQRWLGLPQDEITGKNLQHVITAESYAALEPRIEAVLKGQEQVFERHVMDPHTQSERFLLMHMIPDYHHDKVHGFYVLSHDITMTKQAEAKLRETLEEVKAAQAAAEEASRAKSEFVANMSHEIRTPMNAVLGLTQLLRDTSLNGLQKDYVDKILSSSRALLQVLNDILDFAKMEAGRLTLESIPFHLEDVVENVSNLFAVTAANRGVEMFIDLDPAVDETIVGDPLRMGQVLNNLVGNAVKFTDKGQICIRVEAAETTTDEYVLKFMVQDSGIGISRENVAGLFEAFSQADTSTTRKYGGSGLGLTISKNLVELMDGQIYAESEIGKGSTFTFTTRVKRLSSDELRQKRVPQIIGSRTLIVDDNCISCDILSAILSRWGLEVETANSGARAIELIRNADENSTPYEFILVDWRMPEMDGLELTEKLDDMTRSGRLSKGPMVIMITEADRHELATVAGPEFGHPILTKPVTPSRLFDTIANLTDNPASSLIQDSKREETDSDNLRKDLNGMHVLLVEDNEVNRQVAVAILGGLGISTDLAEDGSVAVDMVDQKSYHAVLMDLQMPVMDGFEATRRIREKPEFAKLPIIAMTAAAFSDDRRATLAAGMNAHVAKPIDIDDLIRALAPFAPKSKPPDESIPTQINPVSDKMTDRETILKKAGIDIAEGMNRLGQDLDLLYRLVKVFATSTREIPAQLTTAIDNENRAEAVRLAHSLKGSSGNIAAQSIYRLTTELEHNLIEGKPGNAALLISELIHLQDTVLALGDDESVKPVPQQFSHSDINSLESLLARQFVIPDDMILKLNGLTAHPVYGHHVKSLLDFLDNYDYANARRILDILKKEYAVG